MTTTTTQTRTTEEQITEVYKAQRTDWVSLATIRTELAYIPRAEIDQALLRMAITDRTAHVDPVANLKSLTQADRDAAIRIGGEDCHAIKVKGAVAYRARHGR